MRYLASLCLAAGLLSLPLVAQADSYTIQTKVLTSGLPADADQDSLQAFNFVDPFIRGNSTVQLQPALFEEGFNPMTIYGPFGPINIGPYQPSSGSFVILDDITITHYSDMFQDLGTSERYVSLVGSVFADPVGDRTVFYPGETVSFGGGEDLLIEPFVVGSGPYQIEAPVNINALLMVQPNVGGPAPVSITPEPSSLVLLSTGLAMTAAALRRKRSNGL